MCSNLHGSPSERKAESLDHSQFHLSLLEPHIGSNMSFIEDVIGFKELVFLAVTLFLVKWTFDLVTDPLKDVPGPFLARFTKLWLLRQYVKGDFEKTNVELHEKFGKFQKIQDPFSLSGSESHNRAYSTHRSKQLQRR